MVDSGFVAEVQNLRARGDLTKELPALRAVGYRQIWGHLEGAYDWQEARRRAIVATRQLAKRQLTWLRGDRVSERWPAEAPGLAQRFWRESSVSGRPEPERRAAVLALPVVGMTGLGTRPVSE